MRAARAALLFAIMVGRLPPPPPLLLLWSIVGCRTPLADGMCRILICSAGGSPRYVGPELEPDPSRISTPSQLMARLPTQLYECCFCFSQFRLRLPKPIPRQLYISPVCAAPHPLFRGTLSTRACTVCRCRSPVSDLLLGPLTPILVHRSLPFFSRGPCRLVP